MNDHYTGPPSTTIDFSTPEGGKHTLHSPIVHQKEVNKYYTTLLYYRRRETHTTLTYLSVTFSIVLTAQYFLSQVTAVILNVLVICIGNIRPTSPVYRIIYGNLLFIRLY